MYSCFFVFLQLQIKNLFHKKTNNRLIWCENYQTLSIHLRTNKVENGDKTVMTRLLYHQDGG